MKLLRDERIEKEDGEIKITIKIISNSQQARLIDLSVRSGASARLELARWSLDSIVEKISVSGVDCDPKSLGKNADLSDDDTFAVMMRLGQVVCDAVFPKGDELKKLQAQPVPGA